MTIEDDKKKSSSNDNLRIKPEALKKKIDKGEDIFILDVRTPEEHKSWKVSYDKYRDSSVIPIDALSSPDTLKQIPKDKEIVTFCTHGNRSMGAAKMLSDLGYNAKSIQGGLDGWNSVYDIADITNDANSTARIWQIRRVSKGCMSYVIATESDKKAIVIDPTCEIDNVIRKIVNENDLKITIVIDTHMHADHLSGATRLAKRYGADVYGSSLEGYDYANSGDHINFKLVMDGDNIDVGKGVILQAIHTPGHTNGSMSFKLQFDKINNTKTNVNNHKSYLFTGDTLFIDGVGRPDLHNKADEFAHNLFNSYRQTILNLSDETIILPAHFSSSFSHEKPISNNIKSMKQQMNLLSLSEDKFVEFVAASIPPQPMNYRKIISINKKLIPCDKVEEKDIEAGPNSCGIRV
jgi:glyoxylase-like metal-dependent hydrolase (beta-lactamase superfamily II)/rhodanese-related sulfurtransferase